MGGIGIISQIPNKMKNSLVSLTLAVACVFNVGAADKKIVLVAGNPSHASGEHEHRAGCLIFKECLDKMPGVQAVVVTQGWPADTSVFDGAAAVVIYADGGGGHPFIQGERLQTLDALAKKGVGIGAVHYACEVPKEKGGKEFLDWIGGYFEMNWSVNPIWEGEFKSFPKHPVARGLNPFKLRDEWYYHMRFREKMEGVTPILTALPPKETLSRRDGPHSGNPFVREAVLTKAEPQHLMWVAERVDGGRGFGFTGGHFHKNWGQDDFRKCVLNGILWIAKVDVPERGTPSLITAEFLGENLDPKGQRPPTPTPPAAK
jgi:type 1 glutamine amidotransferase